VSLGKQYNCVDKRIQAKYFCARGENVKGKYTRADLSELQGCDLAIPPVT